MYICDKFYAVSSNITKEILQDDSSNVCFEMHKLCCERIDKARFYKVSCSPVEVTLGHVGYGCMVFSCKILSQDSFKSLDESKL